MDEINFKRAKSVVLKFLAASPKSQKDIEDKLRNKGFDKDVIDKVLDDLKESGFVDDKIFAFQWTRARVKNKMWGRNKVKSGLVEKGISKEIIEGAIKEIEQEISSEEVIKKAFKKWLKAQGSSKGSKSQRVKGSEIKNLDSMPLCRFDSQNKARAFRHLITKGFQPSLINQTLNKYYKDNGEMIVDEIM